MEDNDLTVGAQKKIVAAMKSPGVLPHDPLVGDRDRCASTESRATFSQAVVFEATKKLATGPNRGLLVYHATGAGKTCAAVAAMAAFWDTPRKFMYCAMHDGLRSVAPSALLKCAKSYFPSLAKVPDIEAQLEKRITRITMTQLSHELQLYKGRQAKDSVDRVERSSALNNTLIILDEVHNLFRPLPQHRNEHFALLEFLTGNDPRAAKAKVVVMTATPGTTPKEVCHLLNIVRDRRKPPFAVPETKDIDAFARAAEGLVSFVDAAKDSSVFPTVSRYERVESPMTEKQYDRYLEKIVESGDEEIEDFDTLIANHEAQKYWASARKYSNSLFEKKPDMSLDDFSCKLPKLVGMLKGYPNEKHYVYSSFHTRSGWGGHGIHMVARALTEYEKYQQLPVNEAIKFMESNTYPVPAKRYILLTSSELAGDSQSKSREQAAITALLRIVNAKANAKGALVHVVLASQNYNEAVDLRGIRHIHLLEPLLTAQAEKQAVGRAVRRCSHSDLDRGAGEWTVTVRRYFAVPPTSKTTMSFTESELQELKAEYSDAIKRLEGAPPDSTEYAFYSQKRMNLEGKIKAGEAAKRFEILMVDDLIFREAQERAKQMEIMEMALRRSAIDCILTKAFHEMQESCISEP
jgi:hypothetical protein